MSKQTPPFFSWSASSGAEHGPDWVGARTVAGQCLEFSYQAGVPLTPGLTQHREYFAGTAASAAASDR